MSEYRGNKKRVVVRANKSQRKILLAAFAETKCPSKDAIEVLSERSGLAPDWITRWFTRQKVSEKKRAKQGCVDLTVKQELLEGDGPSNCPKCRPQSKLKKEESPEIPVLSSPTRCSSPNVPSSSPPGTPPPHPAGHFELVMHGRSSSPMAPQINEFDWRATYAARGPLDETSLGLKAEAEDERVSLWSSAKFDASSWRIATGGSALGSANVPFSENGPAETGSQLYLHPGRSDEGSTHKLPTSLSDAIRSGSRSCCVHRSTLAALSGVDRSPSIGTTRTNGELGASGRESADIPRTVDAVELEVDTMMEELLATLEEETDVVRMALLLSQLYQLGLRW